ncbi:YCF48-related protein [Colwellia sp. UCD-KL20]|uniref:WD40/YVTN/BNR-like repeat-containing protein n=1 Tax=Colwellia sp. UCD-KL20 TaxID=1917165 RepID=UPI00117768F7|nr:YCF48-related protein [Colwellia sp. UCD-KL20]
MSLFLGMFFQRLWSNMLYIVCFFLLLNTVDINAQHMTIGLPQWKTNTIENKPSLRASGIYKNSLWVAGTNNAVFVSRNRGESWQNSSVSAEVLYDFRDIEVFDENTAIVMGAGSGSQSVLFITQDGGSHWKLLNKNQEEKGFYNSIGFWDKNNGLLLGDPLDGYYVIKRTKDGGKTWTRVKKNHLPKMLENESAFAASGSTLIVGENGKAWFTTGGRQASLYVSTNYGDNWQRMNLPLFDETLTAGGYALYQYEESVFTLGGDYKRRDGVYKNLSLVKEGEVISLKSGNRGLRTAMSCIKSICIITGKLSSDISFNYGVTWQPLKNNKKDIGFYTIASNNELFLGAGDDGKVGVLLKQ